MVVEEVVRDAVVPLELFHGVCQPVKRRVVMASLLLLGLVAMAWWVWKGNAWSLNIGI